jgi:hypothetical protein
MSLKRQLDQCVWTESFIKYQQQVLKPEFYVEAQNQFDQYILMLVETKQKPVRTVDTHNIHIEGDVLIIERSNRSRSNSGNRKPNNISLDFYERSQGADNRHLRFNSTMQSSQTNSHFTDSNLKS